MRLNVALLAIALSGCVAAMPPIEDSTKASMTDTLYTVVAQLGERDSLVVRHNPADCACPAFEVASSLGPIRTMLQVSDLGGEQFIALQRAVSEAPPLASFRVSGLLSPELFICGRGTPFVVLNLEGYEGLAERFQVVSLPPENGS